MKKALLASTALIGAALLSAPAQAGTVGSGDNMTVKLSGFMWFQAHLLDEQNVSGGGFGRGYDFDIPETEIHISAANTADNGIKYGVTIEIEVNTDAGNNADEVYAFISGDFGRLELGDNDGPTNSMLVGAYQAHKGLSGPFGGLGGIAPVFRGANLPYKLARVDWQAGTTQDATKLIYFSPRFSGFQIGASYTVDGGGNGASFGQADNNGSWENVVDLGINYTGKFDDVGLSVSVLYETAEKEAQSGALNNAEDLEFFFVGAKVNVAGFTLGADYRDNGDTDLTSVQTAAGADSGNYWGVALGYQQGPWGVSGWYSLGQRDDSTTSETELKRWGIGGQYAVAKGWSVRADYNNNKMEITGSSDRDQQAFILTNMFSF